MRNKIRIGLVTIALLGVLCLLAFFVMNHNIPVLNPKGMIGMKQRDLLVICSLLMCIVVIPVFIIMIYFAWKYKEGKGSKHSPDWDHNVLAECIWWGIPFIIVVILAVITWRSTHELNPFKPIASENKPIVIQAIALDWKWLFIYPEQGIATINYVQFPVNTPLNFEITADAPMNSFWIPQLGGQIYAMPAMRTKLHLIANEEGEFRGASSNISGAGFAGMVFKAVATSEDEYRDWVSSVKSSSQNLSREEYNQLVLPSQYNPVSYYSSVESGLFDYVVMKYMQIPEK